MNIRSEQIVAYIDYLRGCGFTVTLHYSAINGSVLAKYNNHQNPYCHYVKNICNKWECCVGHQEKVLHACQNGSFFGCCYAGVGEFVYPIRCGAQTVGFVSVSGYSSPLFDGKARHFAEKNGFDAQVLAALGARYLHDNPPKKEQVDAVIEPLIYMLAGYFEQQQENASATQTLYHRVLRYVTENYHNRLTMKELSLHFHYSVSTLSHLFFKYSGKSLPHYIAALRLSEAEWYLVNSQASITEIALFLGYNSSNYFAAVFKKAYGITPREYRMCHAACVMPPAAW